MKSILVACGTALATSTVVAKKIKNITEEHGIESRIVQARAQDVFKMARELKPDLIVCTCLIEEEINIPVINGVAFLTGINVQKSIDQMLEILKKA